MKLKLKKTRAEDLENDVYAEYVVVGHEHITVGKYRKSYQYTGRDGWGQNGTMDWWQARNKNPKDEMIRRADGPTRKSCMEEVAEFFDRGYW